MSQIFETQFAGRTLTIETGKLARLAGGAVTIRYGDTVVLGKYAQGFTVEQARRYHEATYSIGMGADSRKRLPAGVWMYASRSSFDCIRSSTLLCTSVWILESRDQRR